MFSSKYFVKKYPDYQHAVYVKRWFLPFSYCVGCGRNLDEAKELISQHKVGFVVHEG